MLIFSYNQYSQWGNSCGRFITSREGVTLESVFVCVCVWGGEGISKIKIKHFGANNNMAKTCDVWYPEQMKVKGSNIGKQFFYLSKQPTIYIFEMVLN